MLKEFLSHPAMIVAGLILLVAGVLSVTACKTAPTEGQQLAAHVAVSYATAKFVEKAGDGTAQAARAARVVQVLDAVQGLADGDSSVTVDVLRVFVIQRLPVDLSPADRTLAGVLIDAAAAELKKRIGDGLVSPDAKLQVKEVLQWIREGAETFAQPAH